MTGKVAIGGIGDNLDIGEPDDHGFNRLNDVVFGCTQQETGLFLSQEANGIFGLYSVSNSNHCLVSYRICS